MNGTGDASVYTDSFVLSVWIEETAQEAKQAKWRGRITHVTSGNYRYLHSLQEIVTFVETYLEQLGVTVDFWTHMRHWLSRWICVVNPVNIFKREGDKAD